MNATVQTSAIYPATLHDWEHVLTRALLRADGGNADPIRSFEITPETLALHCGLGVEHTEEVENAFRRALVRDPNLYWCLQHGRYRSPTPEVPNCMAILALSLLVDSQLDGEYKGQGHYRAKLAQWLGTPRTLMWLRGIATMWEQLASWLDDRVAAGESFRRLMLPDIPKTWTHIGYTRYLSFPTKRDVSVLRKLVEHHPNAGVDARALVLLFDPLVRTSSISFGLKIAFDDFRTALRAGTASIDHRFWRLVTRARKLAGQKDAPHVSLLMEFDEDGRRYFQVRVVGQSNWSFSPDIGNAAASLELMASQNLGPSIRRGILFMRSSGLASWTALGEPPSGIEPLHIAVADRHIRFALGANANFECSGTWYVTTEPVARSTVADLLSRLDILNAKETVRSIDLVDGVRVGRAWLGQPRYLPHVEGAVDDLDIKPLTGNASSTLSCVKGALRANGAVEGHYTISDRAGCWSRHMNFVPMAEVHPSLQATAYSQPLQEEWRLTAGRQADRVDAADAAWSEHAYEYQDLLEALYASSSSGIGEGEAITIIDRAVGRRAWDMLRTLQEASFLDARIRERWRGRVFTLGRAAVSQIKIGTRSAIIASGALPSRLQREFRETVVLQGGIPFCFASTQTMAPPLIGAFQVEATAIAEALGWEIAIAPTIPDGTAAARLIETNVVGESYKVASAWDWSMGRFRTGVKAVGSVSLTRLVHPGGRDHDLYRVTGARQRTFISRHAAILDAHLQAGRPLFRANGAGITRIAGEGALPLEIVRGLRIRTLVNGGASADGWSYTAAAHDVQWLASLMPGLIDGVDVTDEVTAVLTHRRGRGARRPLWIDGGITA